MIDPTGSAKAIFGKALEFESVDERSAYVHQACVDDAALRSEVESLLLALDHVGSFMSQPVLGPDFTVDEPTLESPGTQIGPYKLLEVIGQGGMGVVYMAEQTEPVARRVALKIIKPGMDSRQVIARFEAERQTLSVMDHPNIAKVLDAGTTDSGRPYFAMELIKGLPITQYCDEHHLTPRERLELFLPICQAIQHAHQKGIIHRDIKPSNILVAEYDSRPVPKVIDFGVAKALHQSLTNKTMFTGFGQIVGTLEYMSPEQASVNQLDVDTRSDIYSLGVLLYELLTGTTPFDRHHLRSAAWDEMLRIIREDEPPRPSTKLSTIDTLASVAANRRIEPAKLTGFVRGELDWVAMKALEKDRNRRYAAAAALAADIQHFLDDEPVQACPPSKVYRLRKFARRNKVAFITTGLVATALVVGTALATWQAIRATRAEGVAITERDAKEVARREAIANAEQARAAAESEAQQRQKAEAAEKKASEEAAVAKAINEFLRQDLLGLADAEAQSEAGMKPDSDIQLRTLLDRASAKADDRFADQPFVRAQVQSTLSDAYMGVGRYEEAVRLREQVRDYCERMHGPEHAYTLMAMNNLTMAYWQCGQHNRAIALEERTLELQRRILKPEHSDTRASMGNLAMFYQSIGQQDKALPLLEQTLELERQISGPEHPDTLLLMNNLAETYRDAGQFDRAIALHEQTLELGRKIWGLEHPNTIVAMNNLALDCKRAGQIDKAVPLFEQTCELMRKVLGPEHPYTTYSTGHLADLYQILGKLTEAEALHSQVLEIQRRTLGGDHIDTLISMRVLAQFYFREGQAENALPLLEESIKRRRVQLEANPSSQLGLAECLFWQARCLVKLARWTEAEPAARESLALWEQTAPDNWSRFSSKSLVGECLVGQQKYAEAEPLLIDGYNGLKKCETLIPPEFRSVNLTDALDRLVQLYEAWGKPDEAAKWRQVREEAGGRRPAAGEKKSEVLRSETARNSVAGEAKAGPNKSLIGCALSQAADQRAWSNDPCHCAADRIRQMRSPMKFT